MHTPTYLRNLNPDVLIDWIGEMEKFSEFECIENTKGV